MIAGLLAGICVLLLFVQARLVDITEAIRDLRRASGDKEKKL